MSVYLAVASILTWSFIPRFLKLMIRLSSQVVVIGYLVVIPVFLIAVKLFTWVYFCPGLSCLAFFALASAYISCNSFEHSLSFPEDWSFLLLSDK